MYQTYNETQSKIYIHIRCHNNKWNDLIYRILYIISEYSTDY